MKEHGLYTLDGYLLYWADHNATVLQEIPSHRLLVIRTDEITKRTSEIAAFAGVALSKTSPEKSHSFKAAAKYNILSQIPPEYLEEKVSVHCRKLMDQFFPAIRTAHDVLPHGNPKS